MVEIRFVSIQGYRWYIVVVSLVSGRLQAVCDGNDEWKRRCRRSDLSCAIVVSSGQFLAP